MNRIIVCGIGTDVGKTLVSTILLEAVKGHYWKPVQAGNLKQSDTNRVQKLLGDVHCYPEAFRLKHPLSPHHAASLEGIEIHQHDFCLPAPLCPLVIEGAGGVLVPINRNRLLIDIFSDWQCEWVIVSRHYLGSINHTLLTIEALQKRQLPIKGMIFNGTDQIETENFILSYTGVNCLGHLYPETQWTLPIVQRYAHLWKKKLCPT